MYMYFQWKGLLELPSSVCAVVAVEARAHRRTKEKRRYGEVQAFTYYAYR